MTMKYIVFLFLGLAAGAHLGNHGHGHSGHGHAYGHLHHDSRHNVSTLNAGTCGVPTFQPWSHSAYIIGGSEAKPNSFPWHVAIYDGTSYICGGSLVRTPSYQLAVVTAAHCVEGRARRYSVVVGAHDRANEILDKFEVVEVKRHPYYSTVTIANDIAVLVLSGQVFETDKTKPICLTQTNPEQYAGHTRCLVSGWGTTNDGTIASRLQYVYKPVLSKDTCRIVSGFDPSNMICGGFLEGGKDSCQGDSGGPFICQMSENDPWELVGIVSWGYGCAQKNSPGVYSDVFALRQWVETELALI